MPVCQGQSDHVVRKRAPNSNNSFKSIRRRIHQGGRKGKSIVSAHSTSHEGTVHLKHTQRKRNFVSWMAKDKSACWSSKLVKQRGGGGSNVARQWTPQGDTHDKHNLRATSSALLVRQLWRHKQRFICKVYFNHQPEFPAKQTRNKQMSPKLVTNIRL